MRGQDVELRELTMRFGGFTAVHPTNLLIAAGEFFSILGPSGCGKTTILRLISGFLEPSSGDIIIGGRSMRGIGPNRRPTALIFQSLALFPMMSVRENVAFGLEARGVPRRQRLQRADELLELTALAAHGVKRPGDLSGGQRQRVAIARALAVEPAVLLLDEPLSALDLKLRQHMRAELRAIQKRVGITFIYITHDQGEALTMSDRIAVMSAGRIEQVDTPDRLYTAPRSAFVATFVGENNLLRGKVTHVADGSLEAATSLGPIRAANPHALAAGSSTCLFVRPERIRLGAGESGEGDNRLEAEIVERALEGPFVNLSLRAADGSLLLVHQANSQGAEAWRPGLAVPVSFRAADTLALPRGEA